MQTIAHKKTDDGVAITRISDTHLALITGRGMGWDNARIAIEVARLRLDSQPAEYIMSEELCEAWAESIGRGGLTVSAATDLFMRRGREIEGYTDDAVVDDAALPYHIKNKVGDPDHPVCNKASCQDRYFRNAMVWDASQAVRCSCNMPKAIDCHMDGIRFIRNAELVARDTTFMRAVEAGNTDTQTAIGTEKQALRDIPQTFDLSADTPEELKAKWPSELPARE